MPAPLRHVRRNEVIGVLSLATDFAIGQPLGYGLRSAVASVARSRGYLRVEWTVLDSNEPAVAFYESLGAQRMDDRTAYRFTGDALASLAARHSER